MAIDERARQWREKQQTETYEFTSVPEDHFWTDEKVAAYAAERERVERERCAGIARKHIESSTAQAIAREIEREG